jgi:hypothetical protein
MIINAKERKREEERYEKMYERDGAKYSALQRKTTAFGKSRRKRHLPLPRSECFVLVNEGCEVEVKILDRVE